MRETDKNNQKKAQMRILAALVSLLGGIVILALKFWAYDLTGSKGVYSDALEGIVNVVASISALIVVYYAAKPADQDHPYGHGKLEYFSAAFEGGLISFAALAIYYETTMAIIKGYELQNLNVGTAIIVGAGFLNLFLGLFLIWSGKKYQSPALTGSGQHVMSDFWTSAGVGLSLVIIYFTGFKWVDILVAYLAGTYLAYTGIKVVRRSVSGLLDEEDLGILKQLARIFEKHVGDGIIQIHHTKVIRAGWFHHIDAHVVVPEFWTVEEAHEKLDRFERNVISDYEFSGEANFHLDPCRRSYCSVCDLEGCEIRQEDFKKRMPVKLDHLRSPNEPPEFT